MGIKVQGLVIARFKAKYGRRLSIRISHAYIKLLGAVYAENLRVVLLIGETGSPQEGMAAIKTASEHETLYQTTWKLAWSRTYPKRAPTLAFPLTQEELTRFFPESIPSDQYSYRVHDLELRKGEDGLPMLVWDLP